MYLNVLKQTRIKYSRQFISYLQPQFQNKEVLVKIKNQNNQQENSVWLLDMWLLFYWQQDVYELYKSLHPVVTLYNVLENGGWISTKSVFHNFNTMLSSFLLDVLLSFFDWQTDLQLTDEGSHCGSQLQLVFFSEALLWIPPSHPAKANKPKVEATGSILHFFFYIGELTVQSWHFSYFLCMFGRKIYQTIFVFDLNGK